jgi:pimeloyl-ACP methyl ester carboxylesterase
MTPSQPTTASPRWTRLAALALIAVFIFTACQPRLATPTPTPAPTQPPPATVTLPPPPPTNTPAPPTATPTQSPGKFIGSSCGFKLPPSLSEGVNLECGYLVVPEDRSDPNSPSLQLAVAILRHPQGATAGDPIIYPEGGPGGSTLEFLNLVYDRRFAPVFEAGRDIILFDQRGVGLSRPALDCPEQDALFFELLDNEVGGKVLTEEEMDQLNLEAMASCAKNLSSKANLADFTSVTNAADVKDLAQALGYEQVNLWGTSYGTRLALEVMRDYPEILRSVVLDSTLPPQVNLYEQAPDNLMRSLKLVFDGCLADADCNLAYPDLEQVFYDTVDALNRDNARFTSTDPISGVSYQVAVSGDNFIDLIYQFLYDTDVIPMLPKLIYDASQGNTDLLALLVGSLIASQSAISDGMNFAVQCAEEIPFNSLDAVEADAAKYPKMAGYFDPGSLSAPFDTCREMLIAPTTAPTANQAVKSDIPTLVLAGEFDPITPPSWGQLVTQDLSHSYFYEYTGAGHAPSLSIGCARQMMIGFIQNPSQAPNDACLKSLEAVKFVTPPPTDVTLVPFEIQEMGIQGVAPDGWEQVSNGVFSRQHSSLDVAIILQQAAPLSAQDLLSQLSRQMGLAQPPEQGGERQANGLTWALYEFTARGVQVDMAIAEKDGVAMVVLLQSVAAERDNLYEKVFLPAVDALKPL